MRTGERYARLPAPERAKADRWLRLRWACSGDEVHARGVLRMIEGRAYMHEAGRAG